MCSSTKCTTCASGYYLKTSTSCSKCTDSNCTSCTFSTRETCKTCLTGYYPSTISASDYYKCVSTSVCPFDSNCLLCSSSTCKYYYITISMLFLQNWKYSNEWKMCINLLCQGLLNMQWNKMFNMYEWFLHSR